MQRETGPSVRPQSLMWRGASDVRDPWRLSTRQGQVCRMWNRVCSFAPHSHESVSQSPVLFSFLKKTMSCSSAEYFTLFSPAQLMVVVLLRFLSILLSEPVCFERLLQQHLGFAVWGVGLRLWKSATNFVLGCSPPELLTGERSPRFPIESCQCLKKARWGYPARCLVV